MNRLRAFGVAAVCAGALLGAAAAPAGATINLNAFPNLTADPATVGQTNLPGSIVIENDSTAPNAKTALITQIRFTPSCGIFTNPPCPSPEPGVITVNPVATGALGSACAGATFNFPVTDNGTGESFLQFDPGNQPALPVGTECRINFTYNIAKSPAVDSQPGEPGMQTDQILRVRFFHPDGFDDPESLGSDFTTINPLTVPPPASTGQRAAALAKCKKKRSKKAKRKCRAKAALLPV